MWHGEWPRCTSASMNRSFKNVTAKLILMQWLHVSWSTCTIVFKSLPEITSEKLQLHMQHVVSWYKEFCWPSLPRRNITFGISVIFDFEEQSFLSSFVQTPCWIRHLLTFILEISLQCKYGFRKACRMSDSKITIFSQFWLLESQFGV